MKTQTALIFTLTASIGLAGCGSAVETNSNANASNTNSNRFVNMNANDLPEGFSNKPVNINANSVEGINTNTKMQKVPDDVSPAPGIPSANELKKDMKKGTVPTPGIPANTEMKRSSSNSANVVISSGRNLPAEAADTTDSNNASRTMKQQRPNKP